MTTCWKGNFINFSIELYFGICSILNAGENPRRRGEEQRNENKVKEIRMPTMKRSLGCGFIKHTWSNSEAQDKIRALRTLAKEGTNDNIQRMKMLRANHDGLRKATSIQAAWTIRILARRTMASHQLEVLQQTYVYISTYSDCTEAWESIAKVMMDVLRSVRGNTVCS